MHAPLLANEFVTVYRSPNPERIYAYTPGLVRLDSGRLVTTMDQGSLGVRDLPGPKGERGEGPNLWQGLIFTSDDRGQTCTERFGKVNDCRQKELVVLFCGRSYRPIVCLCAQDRLGGNGEPSRAVAHHTIG